LGGHSLKAARLVSAARKVAGLEGLSLAIAARQWCRWAAAPPFARQRTASASIRGHGGNSPLSALFFTIVPVASMLFSIAAKWVIAGRFKAGDYPMV
jgi:hypothetical protein